MYIKFVVLLIFSNLAQQYSSSEKECLVYQVLLKDIQPVKTMDIKSSYSFSVEEMIVSPKLEKEIEDGSAFVDDNGNENHFEEECV